MMYVLISVRSLQAKQLELERQQATDNLRKGLEKRPEKEELIERKWPQLASVADD